MENLYRRLALYMLVISLFALETGYSQNQQLEQVKPVRTDSTLNWYDIRDLGILGKGWQETGRDFERLPAKAESMVPHSVWNLSHDTAGLNVQFATNAGEIHARWTLIDTTLAGSNMSATGVSGLDLYLKTEKHQWSWAGSGKPTVFPTNTAKLIGNLSSAEQTFMLYLPLYNGVSSVEIGLPPEASFAKIVEDDSIIRKPIVFYGTSITQGASASRPGLCATAMLNRRLNRPIINLGFSGSGKMEPELAILLSEIDASLYFIDCSANMTVELTEQRVESFVEILRQARPETPIVLVEERESPKTFLFPDKKIKPVWVALRKAYENLMGGGIKNLHYIYGLNQIGTDGEGTVDGSHPNDLGFWRQADFFEPSIRSILLHANN